MSKSGIYLLSPTAKDNTTHLPMIRFSFRKTDINVMAYDVLMFTSKQAVLSAETLNPEWKKIPCLAIGNATARCIESLDGTVLHQAKTFYAKELSTDIIRIFSRKKILYLRPKEVSFDSKTFLTKAGLQIDEQILYETSCIEYKEKSKPKKNAIIIFTSPSTIHCFFKNFIWDDSYRAIVIGQVTKEHLPSNIEAEMAATPLIEDCIIKAKQILLTSNCK